MSCFRISTISLALAAALALPFAWLWFSANLQAAPTLIWPLLACLGVLASSVARLLRGRGGTVALWAGTPVIFIFAVFDTLVSISALEIGAETVFVVGRLGLNRLEAYTSALSGALCALGYTALIIERVAGNHRQLFS